MSGMTGINSTPTAPPPPSSKEPLPQRRKRPVVRLDSLKNPQPRPAPQARKGPTECPNSDCGEKGSGIEEDGKTICGACGSVITEMTMVSEVSYGLAAGGAHVVHGYHVGATQAYAKRGDVVDRNRAMSSRDVTLSNGHRHIVMVGLSLRMNAQLRESGDKIFALCVQGFVQGRRTKSVAAVALYIACRTQKETNQYMLIDFADILNIDVFNLGHVYKDMLDHIRLNGTGIVVAPINPEDLILRFCEKLDFGRETMKVAKDAVRIVQRMNRDWMTPGRRPAGICGAALILAARMNNFRRTVQEVVYVVKVQEQTILHRLDEFKGTESSGLTVEEFRTIDLERLAEADPPIFTQQQKAKDGKTKRGRKRKHLDFDDDGDNNLPTVISSRASSATPSVAKDQLDTPAQTQQKAQIDSQNMPPPPLPIDPSLVGIRGSGSSSPRAATEPAVETQNRDASPTSGISAADKATSEPLAKKRRGRPPKDASVALDPLSATHLTGDPASDADITVALTDPTNIHHANALKSALGAISNPSPTSANQTDTVDKPANSRGPIPNSEEIFESEFWDDAEVNNCLLNPSEVAIKTRIWTHENRDYIRAQTAKALKQQLAEAAGTARIIVRRKRRRKRMGDMTAYIGEDGEEGVPVAGSPAEAVAKMMDRRAYSKKLNYSIIKDLYQTSSSGASSRRASSASVLAQSPGSGFEMSGALIVTSPGGNAQPVDAPEEAVVEEEESVVGDQDKDEQQKELNTIAGALEEEIDGIDEDEDDDDPYDDGGNYSD